MDACQMEGDAALEGPTMSIPFRPRPDDNDGGPHWGRQQEPSNFGTYSQWSNNQQIPPVQEYRQAPSSSPYQNSDFASSFASSSSESRPSTNASTWSFNTQYSNPRNNSQGSFSPPHHFFTNDQEHNASESRNQGAPQPRPLPNTGATRSRFLRPEASTYSLSQEQLTETNRNTGHTQRKPVPSSSNSSPPPSLQAEDLAYICDACLKGFDAKTPRFRCTVCDDYDLCPGCYQEDRTSKGHSTKHKVMSINKTHELKFNDITPANVIPEKSPPCTLPNWTVDNEDRRWLHLRDSPYHERYIVHGMSPGAYMVQVVITFKFSEFVTTATLNQLRKESLGEIKVTLGAPVDVKEFFSDQKNGVTKDNLAGELLSSGRQFTSTLKLPDEVTNPNQTWSMVFDYSKTPIHIGTKSDANNTYATLGALLQWSSVRKFTTNDNPILLCAVEYMRMDELLEYDEPPPPVSMASISQPRGSDSSRNSVADNDDDDHVTLEELLDATKILVDNDKAVTPENLLTIVMATREVQNEFQKALLLRHIQRVQQQQRLETQQRLAAQQAAQTQAAQAQARADLFLLSLLLS
ncbi:ubiquitin-ligase protein [Rutstroemia sp. NJR-2017a WRK4]|nr:ubiquitin-ligase protein [Rutstroemia sp. NJR-2017a WRK4]